MTLIFTIVSLFFMPASLAEGAFEILLPRNTSLWVANGKARRVAIASHQGEIDTWNMEVTDNKGHTAHVYSPDIIFPQKIGGKSVYVKHILVPETLKSGEYKLKICGSLKDGRKLCQKSDAFYIEGDQMESLHSKDDLQPHEKRFRSRLSAFEDYLRKLDVEEIWPIHETHCTIPKIHKPSKEEFTEKCMKPGQACIITGMMDNWKAMSKWLFETFQHDPRIEDGVYVGQRLTPVPLTNYVKYLKERAANETAPWVIFMSDVFDLYPELREDYIIPDFFAESDDFMNNVDEELRLDWRWIIMAAKRSGSGWHVDPANTTGWLALVQGAKLWGMYPPSVYHIPGVKNNYYQKRDYDMEDAFYWWIYTRPYLKSNLPIKCVQKPGDIVFIPTGWWHSVVNLDDTVSVTQNFCNKYSLRNCLTELREQADSDGGFIGRTFEQLRELYAEKYPQYFQQEDLDFGAPVKGHGLTEEEEKSRRLQVLKDFLSGSTKTIV